MEKKEHLGGFRLHPRYIEKLDRIAARETKKTGRPCTRTDALMKIIREAKEPDK